jgi:carbamoyltransferase
LSGALTHDPSAALYIDGKLVAAAEEERFVRDKHAKNRMPYEAAKFCLEFAGIRPAEVDAVAIPFAPISLAERRAGTMPSATGTRPSVRWTPS